MCLLKREQNDTGCGHQECKNFYMINKQFCVHNPNQAQITNNVLNPSNFLLQSQSAPKGFSPPTNPFNMNLQQTLNNKRLANLADNDAMDTESVVLNKKKLKSKDENTNQDGQQTQNSSTNNTPFSMSELATYPQQLNALIDNRNMLNSQLLNSMLLVNPMKPDLSGSQYNDVFTSALQGVQGNNMVINTNNQANGFNLSQLMSQNQKLKTSSQMNNFQENGAFEGHVKIEHGSCTESTFREFQTKILGLLCTQNKMLVDLKEKNEIVQDTLVCLISEINILKGAIGQGVQPKLPDVSNPLMVHQTLPNSSETASTETLINYLYGPKPDFQYHLVLKNEIPLPLYRERNFKFTVMLVDQNGKPVTNSNRIPLTIGIYSSENPPKYIDANTAGNKILKGFIEKDLVNGSATFEKIQVKEVTSHFRNGWIFFVVYPKVTKTANNNLLMSGNGVNVKTENIRPLVLEKVIVKAKKTKEKEETPLSDNCQNDSVKEDNL